MDLVSPSPQSHFILSNNTKLLESIICTSYCRMFQMKIMFTSLLHTWHNLLTPLCTTVVYVTPSSITSEGGMVGGNWG